MSHPSFRLETLAQVKEFKPRNPPSIPIPPSPVSSATVGSTNEVMVEQKGHGKSGGRASGAKGKKVKLDGKQAMVLENEGNLLISDDEEDGEDEFRDIDLITAPLISHDAAIRSQDGSLPQYGVLGKLLAVKGRGFEEKTEDKRLYCNINTPFTAVVCGVQGSGKSHTVSVLLESMLIEDPRLGQLPAPLSALVCHFGESGSLIKPCEAAFVGQCEDPLVQPPEVVVYCSPSNLAAMTRSYAQFGGGVKVYPLFFEESDVDASSLMSLMAVSESGQMPLYMHLVMSVLAELGETYTYPAFKSKLKHLQLEPIQERMLHQRLSILENFLCKKIGNKMVGVKSQVPVFQRPEGRFQQGMLTIMDMTDPFISPSAACSLFEIVVKLFNKADLKCSKVVVLDEAHKYLSMEGTASTEGSKRLTEKLLSLTRQQRHLAMRVIISTQEPTVVPSSLLDLCSFVICHRFFSASWFGHIIKHISSELDAEAFDRIVNLRPGECLLFSPTARLARPRITSAEFYGYSATPAEATTNDSGWGGAAFSDSNKDDSWAGVGSSGWTGDDWGGPPVKKSKLAPAGTPSKKGGVYSGPEGDYKADGGWGGVGTEDKKEENVLSGWDDEPVKEKNASTESRADISTSTEEGTGDNHLNQAEKDEAKQAETAQPTAEPAQTDAAEEIANTSLASSVASLEIIIDPPTVSAQAEPSGWATTPVQETMQSTQHDTTMVEAEPEPPKDTMQVAQLGRGYLIVKTRQRITDDGGRSVMATDVRW